MRLVLLIIIISLTFSQAHKTHFEKTNGLESSHPDDVISYYQNLSKSFKQINIAKIGEGDSGRPIYNVIVSNDGITSPKKLNGRAVIFVLNGIHSGEACGIDATQMLVRDLALQMKSGKYENTVFITIPVFNVGGHANFHPYNRVNQNGPKEMGFRANSKNLNLNRDFMKAETANLHAFKSSFHLWNPHVFIDNHSTNGADYQYNLTYMINETDDTIEPMKNYVRNTFLPHLESEMKKQNDPISPYVNLKKNGDISKGLNYYMLTGRFSTMYASFFNAVSVLVETHMLKPFKTRVESNNRFMWTILKKTDKDFKEVIAINEKSDSAIKAKSNYGISWKRDNTQSETIDFLGFEYSKVLDPISNMAWVKYDSSKPKTIKLPHYKTFKPRKTVVFPKSYIIPRTWKNIATKLKHSGVRVTEVTENKVVSIEEYKFTKLEWRSRPFEGEFLPKSFKYDTIKKKMMLKKGDFIVPMNQSSNRFIIEALAPDAADSFFRWGMFNSVFTQIEYFSPYLFVDKVEQIFKENPQLKEDFYTKLKSDTAFAKNSYGRLNYIYKRSNYAEKDYMVYPIKRLVEN